jgi:hypothetical protein
MNPTWFMPDAERELQLKAFAVCRRCPVSDSCLDYGVRTRQTGIYGGILLDDGWNKTALTQESVRARLFTREAKDRVAKRLRIY